MKFKNLTEIQINDLTLVKELITDYFCIDDFTMDRKIENTLPRFFYYSFATKYTPHTWGKIAAFLNQDHATAIHASRKIDDLLSYDKDVQAKHEELQIIFNEQYVDTAKVSQLENLILKYTEKLSKLKIQYYELTDTKFENKENIQEIECEAIQLDPSGLQIAIG